MPWPSPGLASPPCPSFGSPESRGVAGLAVLRVARAGLAALAVLRLALLAGALALAVGVLAGLHRVGAALRGFGVGLRLLGVGLGVAGRLAGLRLALRVGLGDPLLAALAVAGLAVLLVAHPVAEVLGPAGELVLVLGQSVRVALLGVGHRRGSSAAAA